MREAPEEEAEEKLAVERASTVSCAPHATIRVQNRLRPLVDRLRLLGDLVDAVFWGHSNVMDDLPVATPRVPDRLGRPDTRCPRITRRSKPMVLGGSCCAGPQAYVGGAVERVCEDLVLEASAVAHNRRSQVLVDVLCRGGKEGSELTLPRRGI
jgi:hypothetical protein